mgnify:CR=1 FL=1
MWLSYSSLLFWKGKYNKATLEDGVIEILANLFKAYFFIHTHPVDGSTTFNKRPIKRVSIIRNKHNGLLLLRLLKSNNIQEAFPNPLTMTWSKNLLIVDASFSSLKIMKGPGNSGWKVKQKWNLRADLCVNKLILPLTFGVYSKSSTSSEQIWSINF